MDDPVALQFTIDPAHPALPGHFPGQPVVPGVLVVDRVVDALESSLGRPVEIAGMPQVKFLSPLLPGQLAQLTLERRGNRVQFAVRCGERAIAQGVLELQEPVAR